jgi:hypothetical protein
LIFHGHATPGKISEMLPEKLSEMGIVAEADKVYGAGSFFVIKM